MHAAEQARGRKGGLRGLVGGESPNSTRTGRCFWTRRPQLPTWRAAMVGRLAAGAVGLQCCLATTRPPPSRPLCARVGFVPPRCWTDPPTADAFAATSPRPGSRCRSLATLSSWTTASPQGRGHAGRDRGYGRTALVLALLRLGSQSELRYSQVRGPLGRRT